MRIEVKHKVFTDLARKTQNFINITKTLANRHQESICQSKFSYSDQIEIPKISNFLKDCDEYASLIGILSNDNSLNVNNSLKTLKFLKINGYRYERGLIVLKDDKIFEIEHVLSSEDEFCFICIWRNFLNINKNLHSIEIEAKSDTREIIRFNELQTKKPFEKIYVNGGIHIPALNLDFPFV